MHTRVERCQGGLSVFVPDNLAAQAGLREDIGADVELTAGLLVVRPTGSATLAKLLAGITPDNLHSEWAVGPPSGSELL